MQQNTCIESLEEFIAQCDGALQWSKTSKFIKHIKKIYAVSFLSTIAACMWLVFSLPDFAPLDPIVKGLLLGMAVVYPLIPVWVITYFTSRVGMSILKYNHYAVWYDFIQNPDFKSIRKYDANDLETKQARYKFLEILKSNKKDSTSKAIQLLNKLQEDTQLSKCFWEKCCDIVQCSQPVKF